MKNISNSDAASAIRRKLATNLGNALPEHALSTRDAIAHVRGSMPGLRCSDQRLTDLIAGAAIIANLEVGWDRFHGRALYGPAHGFQAV